MDGTGNSPWMGHASAQQKVRNPLGDAPASHVEEVTEAGFGVRVWV
ncbi:hypothetical protein ABTG33_19350 [Acinetobacter baumannii]